MSRDLLLIALSLMTWGLGEGMFYLFQPLYLEELGADPVKIGGLLGLVGLSMIIAYLPAGYISDRVGRRPLLRLAWVMGTLSTILMALAQSLPVFVAGMLIYGMTAFVTVPLNSYTSAARGRWSVTRTLTLISASYNLGAVAGPLIGGWVAAEFGLQTLFKIASFPFVISTITIFLIRAQPVETAAGDKRQSGIRPLMDRRFLGFIGLTFLFMFGMYLPVPLTQNFLQNERGVDLVQIGLLGSARSLGTVVLNLGLGQLNAHLGFALAQAGVALSSLLIWQGGGMPAYMGGYFLMGGYNTARNLRFAQLHAIIQPANMGIAYGLLETANSLVITLAPPLAGLLFLAGPESIYIIGLLLTTAGLIANLWFTPRRQKNKKIQEEKEKPEWSQS